MVLREIALDPVTGDLRFDRGQLVILEGSEAVAQRIKVHLRTLLGEWVFDTSIGVPWFQQILTGTADAALVSEVISDELSAIEGVQRVDAVGVAIDRSTRVVTVTIRATAETGESLVVEEVSV